MDNGAIRLSLYRQKSGVFNIDFSRGIVYYLDGKHHWLDIRNVDLSGDLENADDPGDYI
ncbi:hypothetical protein D3C81_1540690 [compost metagenome]